MDIVSLGWAGLMVVFSFSLSLKLNAHTETSQQHIHIDAYQTKN